MMDAQSTRQSSKGEIARLPSLVDIQTIAHSLGISMRQVRRFVAEGQIPFVRIGHLIRFDPDEMNDWIDLRRTGSMEHP
jgi:excisionase family DNA binding protein